MTWDSPWDTTLSPVTQNVTLGGVAPYPAPVTPCSPSQPVRNRQPTDTTERYATRSLGQLAGVFVGIRGGLTVAHTHMAPTMAPQGLK